MKTANHNVLIFSNRGGVNLPNQEAVARQGGDHA